MVFVPNARGRGGRTSAFGQLRKPLTQLRKELNDFFRSHRVKRHNSTQSKFGVLSSDSLRSRLTHILELDVVYQPAGKYVRGNPGASEKWKRKPHTVMNPIWDCAPKGAYYKTKRFCSLTRLVCQGYVYSPKLVRDLERLSINMWSMSKGHYDGLIRRIRAEVARLLRESPVAPEPLGRLTGNPLTREREIWCTLHRHCQHKVGYTAMRLSTRVDLVTQSLLCTRCAIRRLTKWFTPHGTTMPLGP